MTRIIQSKRHIYAVHKIQKPEIAIYYFTISKITFSKCDEFKSTKIKALSVSFDQGRTYVYPSLSSIMNKSYPISRPLFFMYENTNVEKAKEISDFTLSDEGQKIIEELGYIPL